MENFEQAYQKLEKILQVISDGKVSLDESMKLYEEADQLSKFCENQLEKAEQKIEMLIKSRKGELETDENNEPLTSTFSPSNENILQNE